MIVPNAHLIADVFSPQDKKPTRDGFGTGSIEAGKANPDVVVLCADLAESTRAEWFQKEFPERFIEMGVAEQNMAGVAAGFAAAGKMPFITSYAAFSPGRNYEQVRTTIALNQVHVVICGMHAGVSVGPDGATHQMLEDIGLMRMLPGMTVIVPMDAEEARKATVAAALAAGPVYLRFGRSPTPTITTAETPFTLGKAQTLWESTGTGTSPKVTIFSTGSLTYEALIAARALEAAGIGSLVVHVATVKPLDVEAVVAAAARTGRVVTVEEHQAAGGFGSAIAECLSAQHPVPIVRLGVQDQFGQSGTPEELTEHYGLSGARIAEAAEAFVARTK